MNALKMFGAVVLLGLLMLVTAVCSLIGGILNAI